MTRASCPTQRTTAHTHTHNTSRLDGLSFEVENYQTAEGKGVVDIALTAKATMATMPTATSTVDGFCCGCNMHFLSNSGCLNGCDGQPCEMCSGKAPSNKQANGRWQHFAATALVGICTPSAPPQPKADLAIKAPNQQYIAHKRCH